MRKQTKTCIGLLMALVTQMTSAVAYEGDVYPNSAYESYDSGFYGDNNCCKNGGIYFNADLLLWRARNPQAIAGVVTETTGTGIGTIDPVITNRTHVADLKWKWEAGFRLGLGYRGCDNWYTELEWTHFDSKAKNNIADTRVPDVVAPDTFISSFTPAFGTTGSFVSPFDVATQWKLHFDVVDLDVGKDYSYCSNWTFTPHFGIRVASIKNKYQQALLSIVGDPAVTGVSSVNAIDAHSEFKGAGLRAGLDLEYSWCGGWSIYGESGLFGLYGRTHNNNVTGLFTTTTVAGVIVGETTTFNEHHDKHDHALFGTDLGAGIRWKHQFCCWNTGLTLQLGWEQHLYLNQSRLAAVTADGLRRAEHDDLSLSGITLALKLDF